MNAVHTIANAEGSGFGPALTSTSCAVHAIELRARHDKAKQHNAVKGGGESAVARGVGRRFAARGRLLFDQVDGIGDGQFDGLPVVQVENHVLFRLGAARRRDRRSPIHIRLTGAATLLMGAAGVDHRHRRFGALKADVVPFDDRARVDRLGLLAVVVHGHNRTLGRREMPKDKGAYHGKPRPSD